MDQRNVNEPNESNNIAPNNIDNESLDHNNIKNESIRQNPQVNQSTMLNSNPEHLNITDNQEGPSFEGSVRVEGANNTSAECISVQTTLETVTAKSPNTLYSLALGVIQEDSLRKVAQIIADNNQNDQQIHKPIISIGCKISEPEPQTPDSLGGAPPSYSFVLRQTSQPRPRLMGTFIPSPSFVLHTPPPNYATAFDIYIDNPLPNPTRTYRFGYMPMYIICPECGYIGVTAVVTKIIMSTHICALVLCLLCCWACAPLPYILRSCKEVHHYCSNCRIYLGMYCPTSPENTVSRA